MRLRLISQDSDEEGQTGGVAQGTSGTTCDKRKSFKAYETITRPSSMKHTTWKKSRTWCQNVNPVPSYSSMFLFFNFPFYHFPGCVFSAIFRYVYFLSFSVLSFSRCAFSVIFQCVTFLPFSVSCNFRSTIFRVVHFPFCHFPGCAFSVLSFSGVCIFYHFLGCAFSIIFRVMHFPF